MTEYDSPQSEPGPDVQPQDDSPDDYIVIQLPAWEMRMPDAPIPNEDEDWPGQKRDYFEHPLNRRSTTDVNPPGTYGGIPIRRHPEPIRDPNPW